VKDVAEKPLTAVFAAGATTGTGISQVFEFMPMIVGSIASIVGIIITILIYKMNSRKNKLEMKLMKAKLEQIEKGK
jgi:NADH:ubiquinone oxidoreductase subunit K